MGGMSFPCIVINTTNLTSFALTLLFNLLNRLSFMLEESHSADNLPYSTNYVISMDGTRSPSSELVPAPVEVETISIENSLPVIVYGDFIRRFQGRDDDDEDDEVRCIVCLNNMKKSDEIRELSNCSHVFHRECLEAWINEDRVTCPLCCSSL